MTDSAFRAFLRELNQRRKALRMSWDVLAKRAGLPRITVIRILTRPSAKADFLRVAAIAEALGVQVEFKMVTVDDFAEQQAQKHARRLAGMVQGTMGLEAQGVDSDVVTSIEQNCSRRLLAGSWKKLWVD